MREGYIFTLCWANALLDSIFNCVSQATPELRSGWPTKSFGGYEGHSYRLNDSFALLTITATGAQMPYVPDPTPVELPHSGCPIADPLAVGAVISWARMVFNLGKFDSAFVVPMVEAPSGAGPVNSGSKLLRSVRFRPRQRNSV